MKLLSLFVFAIAILGCSEIVPGTCYLNPAGGVGGADSTAIAAGVGATTSGDYPAEPPKQPQDSTDVPPECYIVPQGPCIEKCEADYEAVSIECGKIEDEVQRRACQDRAYATYKNCRERCLQASQDCLEECKEQCDRENEKCIKNCPKGDKNCMNECNQALGRCYRECEKRCK